MKKVLMIANQFSPMGGSGVQRSVKFVKHLRKFGYEPIVFTRDTATMELIDETLLKDIPKDIKIIRTKAYDFTEWKSIFKFLGKVIALKMIIPDPARVWAEFSKKKIIDLIKEENIKLIYTTSAPYSDHLLGLYIKKNIKDIIWIADFRDEWTNNPYTLDNPHNIIRTKIEDKMELDVLNNADALITNTPVMRKNFIENRNLKGDNFYVIPNGYDEEDFEEIEIKDNKNEKMTLVYTGALYGRRKPDTFFEALKQLKQENKIDSKKIKVQLMGNYYIDKLQAKINSYGLKEQFEIIGYVPHNVCIKHQLESDVLVLIEGTGRGAEAFYTGKIFEYMNTGKPVLALLPENGAAADLVRQTNIGLVADTDNIEDIKKIILEYYNKWIEGSLEFNPDRSIIEKFERKELTKNLAEIFDKYSKN